MSEFRIEREPGRYWDVIVSRSSNADKVKIQWEPTRAGPMGSDIILTEKETSDLITALQFYKMEVFGK